MRELSISFFRIPLLFHLLNLNVPCLTDFLSISFFRIPLLFLNWVTPTHFTPQLAFNILFQDSSSVSSIQNFQSSKQNWLSISFFRIPLLFRFMKKLKTSLNFPFNILFQDSSSVSHSSRLEGKQNIDFQYPFSGFLFCFGKVDAFPEMNELFFQYPFSGFLFCFNKFNYFIWFVRWTFNILFQDSSSVSCFESSLAFHVIPSFNILFQDSSSVSQEVMTMLLDEIKDFQYPFSGFLFCFCCVLFGVWTDMKAFNILFQDSSSVSG